MDKFDLSLALQNIILHNKFIVYLNSPKWNIQRIKRWILRLHTMEMDK